MRSSTLEVVGVIDLVMVSDSHLNNLTVEEGFGR